MRKRFLCTLLGLCLLMTLLPATALAENITVDGVAYEVKGDFPDEGFTADDYPTKAVVFTAGAGKVWWNPSSDVNQADILTLDNATISGSDLHTYPCFTLPAGKATLIKLVGNNEITTSRINFQKTGEGAITLTGPGTLTRDGGGDLIDTLGQVTLENGTFNGTIKAKSVNLNNVTIPEFEVMYLNENTGDDFSVTAAGTKVNGALRLPKMEETVAPEMIKGLELSGSGYVQANIPRPDSDEPDKEDPCYYTLGGEKIPDAGSLNFSDISVEENVRKTGGGSGNWSEEATVSKDGYQFSGNKESGYKLELGNLIMPTEKHGYIRLPNDGPVTVILTPGTTTRIYGDPGNGTMQFQKNDKDYPCTITGGGRLVLTISDWACLFTQQPLTIAGGDITVKNDSGVGIDAATTSLSIIGGRLRIISKKETIRANTLGIGNGIQILSPAGGKVGDLTGGGKTIVDSDGAVAKNVVIEPAPEGPEPSYIRDYNDPRPRSRYTTTS